MNVASQNLVDHSSKIQQTQMTCFKNTTIQQGAYDLQEDLFDEYNIHSTGGISEDLQCSSNAADFRQISLGDDTGGGNGGGECEDHNIWETDKALNHMPLYHISSPPASSLSETGKARPALHVNINDGTFDNHNIPVHPTPISHERGNDDDDYMNNSSHMEWQLGWHIPPYMQPLQSKTLETISQAAGNESLNFTDFDHFTTKYNDSNINVTHNNTKPTPNDSETSIDFINEIVTFESPTTTNTTTTGDGSKDQEKPMTPGSNNFRPYLSPLTNSGSASGRRSDQSKNSILSASDIRVANLDPKTRRRISHNFGIAEYIF